MNKGIVWVLAGLLVGVLALMGGRETAVSATPEAIAASFNWSTPQNLSTGIVNAKRPALAAAPDGQQIMVAYSQQTGDNIPADIYYVASSNRGASWTSPAPILVSPGVQSSQVHLDVTESGVGHAAWREGNGLAYANSTNWNTSLRTLSSPFGSPGVTTPTIVVSGNAIYLVWSEGDGNSGDPVRQALNIYFRRSLNGGSTWENAIDLSNNFFDSVSPAIALDGVGNIHVVWQEQDRFDPAFGPSGGIVHNISYRKGTLSGGTINWSTRIKLSEAVSISTPFTVAEPDIIIHNNQPQVSFSVIYGTEQQFIYHVACDANCDQLGNWESSNNISGSALYVNVSPVDLAANIVSYGQCALVFFDGATSDNLDDNEQIWSTNSCGNWSSGSLRGEETPASIRTLRPSADSPDGWWLYLAYEEVIRVDGSNANQVMFMRTKPNLYLPIIRK
jgi:hypothetical protein